MSALTDFLTALAAVEAAVVPEGGSTPIGSGNTYALQPKPTASAPLVTPCIINIVTEGEPGDLATSGYDATDHKVEIYFYSCPADEQDAWVDSQPYLVPLRKALKADPNFNNTCSFSLLGGYKQGYYKYRGRWYYGIGQSLTVKIHNER